MVPPSVALNLAVLAPIDTRVLLRGQSPQQAYDNSVETSLASTYATESS